MPRRDGARGKRTTSLLSPINRVADVDSAAQDVQDGDSLTMLVQTGANVDAGFLAVLEEADAVGGPFTVVGANDFQGDIVKNTVDTVFKLGYVGRKRFVRVALTIPGSTDVGVVGVLGHLHQTPEADKT